MIINCPNEEYDLYWEVFFQGLEQPCQEKFCENENIVINPKKQKEKIIDKYGNVGFKDGKHIHRRPQYNCTGKYKEIPRFRLWEEEMVFNPDKDFEYEIVIKVKD